MSAYKERKTARYNLKKLVEDRSKVLFIHYSQSRTYNEDEYGNISPIITSVVIKSLDDSIDKQFAIHFEADKADIPIEQIQDSYRDLELRILKAYNNFVIRHQNYIWVHWDMRNIHFGFDAIKHRYEKIFENLNDYCEIPQNKKQNLRLIIEGIYGEDFVKGPDYLESLLRCNNNQISDQNYLSMDSESNYFEEKNFEIVIRSVDAKVEFIRKATNKLIDNKLIVINKNNFAIFVDIVKHPIFTFIGWAATILGLILGTYSLLIMSR